MKFCICIMLFFSLINRSKAQNWEIIYPNNESAYGDLVKGIITNDSTRLYVIGNDIFVFDSAGNFLNKMNSLQPPIQEIEASRFFDIHFISEATAYMIHNNKIYTSTDSGINWTQQLNLPPINTSILNSSYFHSVYFPTENTGYVVGNFKKIFKTRDGGDTWEEISSSPSTKPYIWYTSVYFIDESVGFVSGFEVPDILMNFGFESFVMKTIDGGQTWQRSVIETSIDFRNSVVEFKTDQIGFIFFDITQQNEKIFVTNDNAQSWSDITPINIERIFKVCWIDSNNGILFGKVNNSYTFLKTINQGQEWYEIPLPIDYNISDYSINDIVFINRSIGFTVGQGGLVLYTNDAGEKWQVVNESTVNILEVNFISDNEAVASSGNELFKTFDGGKSWVYLEGPTNSLSNYVTGLKFKNSNEGYVLGLKNQYLKTNDALNTYTLSLFPENFFLFYKHIDAYENNIYIAGTTVLPFLNKLLISDDGGSTWDVKSIGFDGSYVNSLQVLEDNTIIILTDFDIVSSYDKGVTFGSVFHSGTSLMESIFINRDIGYTFSNFDLVDGKIKKVFSNQVDTFESITVIQPKDLATHYLLGILPINENLLFAYGYEFNSYQKSAVVWKSINGGKSWEEEILPVKLQGHITYMKWNENNVLAITSQGAIIRTQLEDLATRISDAEKPKLQIYPNPASNTLIISNLHKKSEIVIYSLNGQLIKSFNSNNLEITINISTLPSGIYLLHCKSEIENVNVLFYKE